MIRADTRFRPAKWEGKGDPVSTNTHDAYLAVFLGSKTSPRMEAWMALPEA